MPKKFLISAAVILLLSSGALANIGQVQCFEIGALNKVKVVGGFGIASGENYLEIGQRQMKRKARLGSAAMKQGGILDQQACVGSVGGRNVVVQNATVGGLQGQLIEGGRRGHGLRAQGQSLTLNLNTKAIKIGGIGGAKGSQSFVGEQSQKQAYRGGFSVSSQFVQAEQRVKIIGGPNSNVVVKNNLDVNMFQGSIAK